MGKAFMGCKGTMKPSTVGLAPTPDLQTDYYHLHVVQQSIVSNTKTVLIIIMIRECGLVGLAQWD